MTASFKVRDPSRSDAYRTPSPPYAAREQPSPPPSYPSCGPGPLQPVCSVDSFAESCAVRPDTKQDCYQAHQPLFHADSRGRMSAHQQNRSRSFQTLPKLTRLNKRIKSDGAIEAFHRCLPGEASRDISSHAAELDTAAKEAELLLHFARGASTLETLANIQASCSGTAQNARKSSGLSSGVKTTEPPKHESKCLGRDRVPLAIQSPLKRPGSRSSYYPLTAVSSTAPPRTAGHSIKSHVPAEVRSSHGIPEFLRSTPTSSNTGCRGYDYSPTDEVGLPYTKRNLNSEPIVRPTDVPPRQNLPKGDESLQDSTNMGKENFVSDMKKEDSTSYTICAVCVKIDDPSTVVSSSNATTWISCDGCNAWCHVLCAGFKSLREVRNVDKYRCMRCSQIHGPTTFVRTSSRKRTKIDYAGLHQGIVKFSEETVDHHHVHAIKAGLTTFNADCFPRIRPELARASFFEMGAGMSQPVIIPAAWNRRHEDDSAQSFTNSTHSNGNLDFDSGAEVEVVPDIGQDRLGMIMPQGLTVRHVAALCGPMRGIEVMQVKSQNADNRRWTLGQWADYYESTEEGKVVRNVISLEFSNTKLARLVRRPSVVRELDLQDAVWPCGPSVKGDRPEVQYYCLMSVTGSFTDFHIDFGGSSVFYHVLKGRKIFLFIPPKEKHLKKYEDWCRSPLQHSAFLPDLTKECFRVDLVAGDTMLIPSGWIHAVWTPEDSLVIGGNFLTRLSYSMQFRVAQIEKNTGVARKFRYPHFQKLHWYAALRYLEEDPVPGEGVNWLESGRHVQGSPEMRHLHDRWLSKCARKYSTAELVGMPDLIRFLLRNVLIEMGRLTDGITSEIQKTIKKEIPRAYGEPVDIVKCLMIWFAWTKGDVILPAWAHPTATIDAASLDNIPSYSSAGLGSCLTVQPESLLNRRGSIEKTAREGHDSHDNYKPLAATLAHPLLGSVAGQEPTSAPGTLSGQYMPTLSNIHLANQAEGLSHAMSQTGMQAQDATMADAFLERH